MAKIQDYTNVILDSTTRDAVYKMSDQMKFAEKALTFQDWNASGSNTVYCVSPWTGTVKAVYSVVSGTTVGAMTGSVLINGSTGGTLTIASGSTAGTVDSDTTITAGTANVTAGQAVGVQNSSSNTAASQRIWYTFLITTDMSNA